MYLWAFEAYLVQYCLYGVRGKAGWIWMCFLMLVQEQQWQVFSFMSTQAKSILTLPSPLLFFLENPLFSSPDCCATWTILKKEQQQKQKRFSKSTIIFVENSEWVINSLIDRVLKVCTLQKNPVNAVFQANHETEAFLGTWLIPCLSSTVRGTASHSTSVLSPYLPSRQTTSRWALNRVPALSQSAQHTWQDQRYHLHQSSYVNPVMEQQTHPDELQLHSIMLPWVCCQPSWFYGITREPSRAYHMVTITWLLSITPTQIQLYFTGVLL